MSNASANRAPLLLALVILLGVGGRWLRGEQAPPGDTPLARVALDSQLAQVERAGGPGGAGRGRGRQKGAGPAVPRRRAKGSNGGNPSAGTGGAARRPAQPDSSLPRAIRSERTPIGAVSPGFLARREAELAAEESKGRAGRARREGGGGSGGEGGSRRARRPSPAPLAVEGRAAELVDLETASAREIERLPRIGPALARRIVEDRAAHGPFGSLEGLQRVRGVGPGVARQLQGHVTFGTTGRP